MKSLGAIVGGIFMLAAYSGMGQGASFPTGSCTKPHSLSAVIPDGTAMAVTSTTVKPMAEIPKANRNKDFIVQMDVRAFSDSYHFADNQPTARLPRGLGTELALGGSFVSVSTK